MSDKSSSSSGGIGVIGLLGVVFVILKLFGLTQVATWSWWWVTAPFWGGIALVLVIMVLIGLFAAVVSIFNR
jgi:hypothetical protein